MAVNEQVQAVWDATQSLSDRQRTVFLLRFVEDLDIPEIAQTAGLTENAVNVHLFRALRRIRKTFSKTKMSNHLSNDQFAKCAAGRAGTAEIEHLAACPDCAAELGGFRNTLSLFQSAIRRRTDDRIAAHAPEFTLQRPAPAGVLMWRWALVAALVVVVAAVPFLTRHKKPQVVIEKATTALGPEALMRAVNVHLSRTVPAPMEPVMALIPKDEPTAESGGVQ